MPNTATVSGTLLDVLNQPVPGGKIVATLNGADTFEDGIRIVTREIETTSDANGDWSLDLIVNAEGMNASTTWAVEGFTPFVKSVFKVSNLFITTAAPILLGDLEAISAASLQAAKNDRVVRLIVVNDYTEYSSLPANQKRPTDAVLVIPGV